MDWSELNDWLALYEIDPWGESRADLRAGVQSVWNRGGKFEDLRIAYPYVPSSDSDEISEEDEIAAIEAIAALNYQQADNAPA